MVPGNTLEFCESIIIVFFFVYFMFIPKRKYNNKLKSNIKLKKYTTIISINTK